MQNFEQYELRKQTLLSCYQLVIDSGILPVDLTGPGQVRDRMQDLIEERFLVAVCGRIKAGKSTLLNALLFRDWIMPTDDMPHTAKNILVEYGEKEALEVTFFSTEEWSALTAELGRGPASVNDEFTREVLAAGRQRAAEDEWIQDAAVVQRYESVAALAQFVTPVNKGGIYTPFVKLVKVIHPHPWLRMVTIADTPGVDDPYKFREDQTKQFVTRANAVLFVTYAGQAMAQPDFDFLNEYLMHVPAERRLIAVNKIDTLQRGSSDVDAYLAGLANSTEPAIRDVFGRRDSVHMVCALGALIAQAEEAGRPLQGDYDFYRRQMAESGHLDARGHGVDALRLKVEERLVTHQGKNTVDGHVRFLTSLFERKQRHLKAELTRTLGRLDDLSQSHEMLVRQIADIEREVGKMEAAVIKGRVKMQNHCNRAIHVLSEAFDLNRNKTITTTRIALGKLSRIDTLGNDAGWAFVESFDKEKGALGIALEKCAAEIEVRFTDFTSELQALWTGWNSAAVLDDSLSTCVFEAIDSLRSLRDRIASPEEMNRLRVQSTGFFQRLFNTRTGREVAASAIFASMNAQLQEGLTKQFDEIRTQLVAQVEEQVAQTASYLKSAQQDRMSDKERLLEGKHDSSVERERLTELADRIREDQVMLDQAESSVHDQLAA